MPDGRLLKSIALHARSYSIAHFLSPRALYEAFRGLRKNAGAGVDDLTYQEYQNELVAHLTLSRAAGRARCRHVSRTFSSRHANSTGPGNKTRAAPVWLCVNSPSAPESLRTIPYLWERPRVGSCSGGCAITHQKDEEACIQF
jgi:hypothetical protein